MQSPGPRNRVREHPVLQSFAPSAVVFRHARANRLQAGVHRNSDSFSDRLLQWRSFELAALDAEGDLRRISQGQYDPRLCELSLLAQQMRSCADAALRALLDTIDSPRQ